MAAPRHDSVERTNAFELSKRKTASQTQYSDLARTDGFTLQITLAQSKAAISLVQYYQIKVMTIDR